MLHTTTNALFEHPVRLIGLASAIYRRSIPILLNEPFLKNKQLPEVVSGRDQVYDGTRPRTIEVIFGIYESSRRRGRIERPLKIYDHPLSAMVEAGQQPPGGRADERPP